MIITRYSLRTKTVQSRAGFSSLITEVEMDASVWLTAHGYPVGSYVIEERVLQGDGLDPSSSRRDLLIARMDSSRAEYLTPLLGRALRLPDGRVILGGKHLSVTFRGEWWSYDADTIHPFYRPSTSRHGLVLPMAEEVVKDWLSSGKVRMLKDVVEKSRDIAVSSAPADYLGFPLFISR